MHHTQQKRYQSLYQRHLSALQRQGKSQKTIEAYSRAVRRITNHFDRSPDRLTRDDLEAYFSALIQSHSWSTVKLDRNGLQFFYKHVSIHSLRRCYGTHLVETGLNLRAIQHAMGHECPKTTAIYTRLTEPVQQNTVEVINRMVDQLDITLDGEA